MDLVTSPTTTLATTVRHIGLWNPKPSVIPPPVFLVLATFVSLRSLNLWGTLTVNLPSLPTLTHLHLWSAEVPSYTAFITFVSGLPALKSLTLWNVSWTTDPDDGQYTFPPLDLASLELDWGPRPPIESIMFALRTRKLILGIPSSIPPSFLPTTSKYLRQLGSHLRHLELEDCENRI
ncbi:hypothetical protein C8R44DRAFT_974160, partial [Mycena epipterygia]